MNLATMAQGQPYAALLRYGAPAVLTVVTSGAYNPATGTGVGTTQAYTTRALLDATTLKTLGMQFGEDLVRTGDLKATIPAKGLAADPKPGDLLSCRGIGYTVVGVRPQFLADKPIAFELLVRA